MSISRQISTPHGTRAVIFRIALYLQFIMEIASIAALTTALCWALAGLLAVYPVQALGPLTFNRIRMQFIAAMLLLVVLITGSWRTLNASHIIALLFWKT